MAALVGNITCGLKVNLLMKTPMLGVRVKLAGFFVRIAAFVLGGNLEVEVKPEITSRVTNQDGSVISEKTTRI